MAEETNGYLTLQNSEQRLKELQQYIISDTAVEEAFNNITYIVAQVFKVPVALISLVEKDEIVYKSQTGAFGKKTVNRSSSLCALTMLQKEPFVIEDALKENLLQTNPYVVTEGDTRFYAGAPLLTQKGYCIGAVCIVDSSPRTFSEADKSLLVRFAKMVMHEIEMKEALVQQAQVEEQLTTSNKELQFVTDTMPQLVWATETNGYSFFFNNGWFKYTGLSFNEVKGDGWMQSLHADDKDRTIAAWRNAVATGATYDIEYRLKRWDGMYRWFVARGVPMKNEAGVIVKWYGTTTDIHDQKLAQEALQQSKERFDLLAKATQDAIWDWNLNTSQVWWNDGFKELFGYKDEDIEPGVESWYGRLHPDDKERVVGSIHDVIDSRGKQWSLEYRFRKKDGSYAIVFDRGYTLHDKEGKAYRMLGSMQDITERKNQQEKLKQSEERFQAAVAAVQGILWTNNAKGEMEGLQPGWAALTGQSYEEYQGYGWAKAVHPADAQPTIDAWSKALKKHQIFMFEHRVKTKSGEWRLFSIRAIPLLAKDGSLREWVGVHTDITEQRLVAEKIKQSEQRFQNLIREATVGIIVLMGEEMRVEVVNGAYGRLIGRAAADLLNQPLFSAIPEAEEAFRPVIDKVRITGEPFYLYDHPYFVYVGEEEKEGFLNIVYQPYKEVDGTTTGVMVLCQDVTAQVLARKKLAEAEETARLAVASAGLGTFNVDLRTNFMITSERLDEIFDVEHKSERSRYVNAVHPEDLAVREKAYQKAAVTGILEYEARIIRKNGAIRWFRIKGRMSFNKNQQPLSIVGVVQDITEEKQFAEELARKVKERTQELEQITFVSHHDLQEPLRKIIIFTEMVRSESYETLSESSKSRLDKVTAAAKRMSAALRDVLNFASLSKEELVTKVDLDETLAAVQTDLELLIVEKKAKVQSVELPTIEAVPQQMHQLFYNLLNNALKFTSPDRQPIIAIACIKLNETDLKAFLELDSNKLYYQIVVQDNGIGFDQKAANKIFVLFQRLHNKNEYAGTGIGLALCRKIVLNHGGIIWAESQEGAGATFNIILPKE